MATVIEVNVSFDIGTKKVGYVAPTVGTSLNVSFAGENTGEVIQGSTEIVVPLGGTSVARLGGKLTQLVPIESAEFTFDIKKATQHPDTAIATMVIGSYEGLQLGVKDAFDDRQSTIFFWG